MNIDQTISFLSEKPLPKRLEILFRKSLYLVALSVAQSEKVHSIFLVSSISLRTHMFQSFGQVAHDGSEFLESVQFFWQSLNFDDIKIPEATRQTLHGKGILTILELNFGTTNQSANFICEASIKNYFG